MTNIAIGVLIITMQAGAMFIAAIANANDDKLAYGKHLSQECTTCHRPDGKGHGIPAIFGIEPDYFLKTMAFYKTGARQNPVMNSVAQMLSDDQLDALAAYLVTQKPVASPASKPDTKSAATPRKK